MGAKLVEPLCRARIRIACKKAGRPLVVSSAVIGVPRSRIRRAVVDELEFGVVRDPTPYAAAADLPTARRPTLHAQVLTFVTVVEWLEVGADEHFFIRPRA